MPSNDRPIFQEMQGKDWVSYGANDTYAQYLEGLYLGSSIHSAIVSGVGAMIYGEGLDAKDREQSDGKREQWLRLQNLLGESDPELLRKLALDLKLYGQCYVNTIWNTARTQIVRMRHLPVHTMRAGVADSEGNVDLWYYKSDWGNKKDRSQPLAIRSYSDTDRTEASRVLQIKRYAPSFHYYGLPDYVGSTGYVQLDMEIQTYHLANIQNGLFPSMLVNFNSGIPTDEERNEIERKVLQKFSGADAAGKVLITFNDGAENQPTFEPVTTNGSDAMYEYLSREVTHKVLSGHRVTSPLLFGVRGDGTGFGNNADELRDSYSLFTNTVVQPFQELLLQGLAPVFATNGISLNLYFKPLKPAYFITEPTEEVMASEVELSSFRDYPEAVANNARKGIEYNERLGNPCATSVGKIRAQQLANRRPVSLETVRRMYSYLSRAEEDYDPTDREACGTISYLLWGGKAGLRWARKVLRELGELEEQSAKLAAERYPAEEIADALIALGEDTMEGYQMIDSRQVDYADEDRQDALWAFAKTVTSRPGAKDPQDNDLIKIRYRYAPNSVSANSREFCKKMVAANKIYRKRDIELAGNQAVNPGFGEGGADTYSIWFYKGGPRCRHYWMRETYLQTGGQISVNQARRLINELPPNERPKYRIPVNEADPNNPEATPSRRPNDMPRKGFSPNNPNLPKDAR